MSSEQMRYPYRLLSVSGLEVEYMIVDIETLDILPVADELLEALAGYPTSDVDCGALSWSNELVLHVVELKTTVPSPSLASLKEVWNREIRSVNSILSKSNATLLPTAMHPWMSPERETKLWPHENNEIYNQYNSIFGCRGHGWSNLQSTHLNLPFANEEEFGRLHAAIRLVLPLIPALAAASPVVDMAFSGIMDSRLHFYRKNSQRIASITGAVIPEAVFTYKEYEERILKRMYSDIAPMDSAGILQHEWLNSRGAIARFDRGSIEIRIIDSQECISADMAICWLITGLIQQLVQEQCSSWDQQKAMPLYTLSQILLDCINDGHQTQITSKEYLALLGLGNQPLSGQQLWKKLLESAHQKQSSAHADVAEKIISRGCLANSMVMAIGSPVRSRVRNCYQKLATCLQEDVLFE